MLKSRSLLALAFVLAALPVVAQNIRVEGVVVDENKETVIGASVMVKGENRGAKTDLDGRFTLKDVKKEATLVVSFIGMKTTTVKAAESLRVVMESDIQTLSESW